jgi:hypothetical protein
LHASAIDTCWQVGVTKDLAACQQRVLAAQQGCTTLPPAVRAACSNQLEELGRAAVEGYHVARHECEQLTSDGAQAMCRGNESHTPTAIAGLAVQPDTSQSPSPTASVPTMAPEVVTSPSLPIHAAYGVIQAATVQPVPPPSAHSGEGAISSQDDDKAKNKGNDPPKKGKKGD